jgi:hypothetical protein
MVTLTVTESHITQQDYNTLCAAIKAMEHVEARCECFGLQFHQCWQMEGALRKITHSMEPYFIKEKPMNKKDIETLQAALETLRQPKMQRSPMYGIPYELVQAAERAMTIIVDNLAPLLDAEEQPL